MRDTIDAAARRLVEAKIVRENRFVGCTDKEIQELEEALGVQLPAVYKSFLRAMGRSAGDFMVGSDLYYPVIQDLQRDARLLVEEAEASFQLTHRHVVFLMHQGYQFLFFEASGAKDPAVFYFLEGEPEPRQVAGRFSEWLEIAVEDEIRARQGLVK